MLNTLPTALPRGGWRFGAALPVLLWLCLAPRDANAAAAAGLSTSFGLAAALLSVLAVHSAAPEMAAGMFAAGLMLLALTTLAWRHAARGRRHAAVRGSDGDPALLAMARDRFVRLQVAWDRADVDALRSLTTAEMLSELLAELPARGSSPNRTDVLMLEARLIALERLGPFDLASIEFSGVVRESPERGAAPFREIWMMARASGAAEADWRLARQQALL